MNKLENSIHDNANGLDYTLVNDHYLPNLTAAAPAEQHPFQLIGGFQVFGHILGFLHLPDGQHKLFLGLLVQLGKVAA